MFTAVVRISGAGRLADFREHLRRVMVRDPDAEDYTEHHGEGFLEYRFTPRRGIPFPALTETSGEFPELRVEAAWEHDSKRGRAVIEAGQLVEQSQGGEGDAGVDVAVGEEGRLELAMVCRSADGECFGYAAAADRHTYFRYRAGHLHTAKSSADNHNIEQPPATGHVGFHRGFFKSLDQIVAQIDRVPESLDRIGVSGQPRHQVHVDDRAAGQRQVIIC